MKKLGLIALSVSLFGLTACGDDTDSGAGGGGGSTGGGNTGATGGGITGGSGGADGGADVGGGGSGGEAGGAGGAGGETFGLCNDPAGDDSCDANLCAALPADAACITCVQTECATEWQACATDPQAGNAGCIDCAEFYNGMGAPTCVGSEDLALDLAICGCGT